MQNFTFVTPGRAVAEWEGATKGRLAEEAKRLGTKPLVVAGSSLVKSGILDAILATLHRAGLSPTVHTGVPPEPDLDALQQAMNAAEGADSVIAIGGGSVLDVAKGAAALAGTGHTAREYHRGAVAVPEAVNRPILAVPTTAGTGSEATWVGVFTDKEARRKASIRGGAMMPQVAFLDAALTVSCSPNVTAYSGMDAFVQAVESYTARGANPLTQGLALEAIRLTSLYLLPAVVDGTDQNAREAMLLGSYMAGVALNTSRLGLVHGLAHPIGAITGAPHGLLCGMLMPAVIQFNDYKADYNVAIKDAPAIGWEAVSHSGTVARSMAAKKIAEYMERLLSRFGAPSGLGELGLRKHHMDAIVKEAMESGSTKANPRWVTELDIRAIVRQCL